MHHRIDMLDMIGLNLLGRIAIAQENDVYAARGRPGLEGHGIVVVCRTQTGGPEEAAPVRRLRLRLEPPLFPPAPDHSQPAQGQQQQRGGFGDVFKLKHRFVIYQRPLEAVDPRYSKATGADGDP